MSTPRADEKPHNVLMLLRLLDVYGCSVEKQAAALRVWLKANPPDPALRLSLLRNGYGHILDEAVGRPPRKPAATMKHSA